MAKAQNAQRQFYANIALKFNLKLGGVNHVLPDDQLGFLNRGDCMLVGIDVTHPSPGSVAKAPSIAGVVASIDGQYAQFPASNRAQTNRQEMVDGLQEMVVATACLRDNTRPFWTRSCPLFIRLSVISNPRTNGLRQRLLLLVNGIIPASSRQRERTPMKILEIQKMVQSLTVESQ